MTALGVSIWRLAALVRRADVSIERSIEIRRRLNARAAELGLDFQQAVLYYAMERFLFRLPRLSGPIVSRSRAP